MPRPPARAKLPAFVYLYFFCQSINLTAAVISVAVAASVGNRIAPGSLYATVPYGAQFLFLLLRLEAKKNDTRFNVLSALIVGSAVVILFKDYLG